MKAFKIAGGIIVAIVATNTGIMLYFNIPHHIKAIVAEENAHPDQPRMSTHQLLSLAFERALDEKYGPV